MVGKVGWGYCGWPLLDGARVRLRSGGEASGGGVRKGGKFAVAVAVNVAVSVCGEMSSQFS